MVPWYKGNLWNLNIVENNVCSRSSLYLLVKGYRGEEGLRNPWKRPKQFNANRQDSVEICVSLTVRQIQLTCEVSCKVILFLFLFKALSDGEIVGYVINLRSFVRSSCYWLLRRRSAQIRQVCTMNQQYSLMTTNKRAESMNVMLLGM